MSTKNRVLLHDVTIPALNRVGYADGLNAAFTAIENNEALLANHDFVKGDKGDSVNIEKISLSQNSDMLAKLKSAIKNGTEPNPINGVAWDSLLNDELYVLYKTEIDNGVEKKVAVSSLYYTFVDGRFVNSNVGKLTINDFDEEVDLSCILVYEDGVFKRLNNVFPTMYFEDGKGLCWKVNGQRTGLPVQGVPGNDGKNSDVIIVRVNQTDIDDNGKGLVSQRWNKTGGWKDITNINELDGYTCFALAPSYELVNGQYVITNASSFYVGTLIVESDKLYVLCKPELSLQQTFGSAIFIEAMQNISLLTNSDTIVTPKGLFVPMKTLGDLAQGEKQPIHLIAATSINNEMGDAEDLMTDMIVTPVSTTDLTVDDTHNLKVDKYMYVKLSDEVISTLHNLSSEDKNVFTSDKRLKYKLSNIIITPNVDKPYTTSENVVFGTENTFNDNGEPNLDAVVRYSDDFDIIIPQDFIDKINCGEGFYQWSIDTSINSYDPDGLVDWNNVKNEDIQKYFAVTYTKTMTPGIGDEILWFNSLIEDLDDFYGKSGQDNRPDVPPGTGTIYSQGVWETIEEPAVTYSTQSTQQSYPKTPIIEGRVYDDNGRYVEGVNIEFEIDMKAVKIIYTDAYGYYSLELSDLDGIIDDYNTLLNDGLMVVDSIDYSMRDGHYIDGNNRIDVKLFNSGGIEYYMIGEPTLGINHVGPDEHDASNILVGYITDKDGQPVRNIHVYVKDSKTWLHPIECTSEEDGSYVLSVPSSYSPQNVKSLKYVSTIEFEDVEGNRYEIQSNKIVGGILNMCYDNGTFSINDPKEDEPTDTPDTPDTPDDVNRTVYKLLRGVDRQSMRFDRFIPIQFNSYRMSRDTSYNLNYNVNITGDELNPRRNLTVNGDVNCENLNVYQLTATGEIKNIYTRDDIVGTRGITLGNDNFVVDELGNVNTPSVTTSHIVSKFIESNDIATDSLSVLVNDTPALNINSESNGLSISLSNTNGIQINGSTNKPTIDSDIPVFLNSGSGVYCTNSKSKMPYKGSGHAVTNIKDKVDVLVKTASSTNKSISVKNHHNNYCGSRKTNYNSIKNAMGTTYIQLENPDGRAYEMYFDGVHSNAEPSIYHDMSISANQPTVSSKIKTQACAAFDITNYNKSNELVCKFSFKKPFLFAISMNSSCSNGLWPQLYSGDSYIKYRVIAKIGKKYVDVTDIKKTSDNTDYDLKCWFNSGTFSWVGYEQSLRSGNSRWDEFVRTYSFVSYPYDFKATIPQSELSSGGTITLYVVPTIYARLKCEDHWFYSTKYLIDYVAMTKFIPYNTSYYERGKTIVFNADNPDGFLFNSRSLTSTQMNYVQMSYVTSESSSDLESTLIDNTGFIYTDGQNRGFGIGNVSDGTTTSVGMYLKDKSSGDYSNTILIKDLFTSYAAAISNYNV